MSRSVKKNPVCGMTGAPSEKGNKQKASRAVRKRVKQKIGELRVGALDPDEAILPEPLEVADPYDFAKDGKMRFDPKGLPKLMRK